ARRVRELARARVLDAIQKENIFQRPSTRDREGIPLTCDSTGTLVRVIDGAGVQCDEVVEAASIERELFDLTLTDQTGHGRCSCIDEWTVGRNGDLLSHIANYQS